MKTSTRRKLGVTSVVFAGAMAGGASAIGAGVGDSERVVQMWIVAEVRQDATTRVTEVIDYDFGALAQGKHGIYRDIPGFGPIDPTVSSKTAPDDLLVTSGNGGDTRLRIGDPFETVSGRHRYTISFGLADVMDGAEVAWDAIGTGWGIPISRAEVHLVSSQEIVDVECVTGGTGSTDPCDVDDVEPGHVKIVVTDMGSNEGITVYAELDGPAGQAPRVEPPEALDDVGSGLAKPIGAGALGALMATFPVTWWIRRAGRDRVAGGGAADAAYATPGSEVRVDTGALADMATTEFEPPRGLLPSHGGALWAEQVRDEHKVAWLMHQAAAGVIEVQSDGKKATGLVRTGLPDPADAALLDAIFGQRPSIALGKYDPTFAKGWAKLDSSLQQWLDASGSFDPAGEARRSRVRLFGVLFFIVGLGACVVAGLFAARHTSALIAVAAAGAVAGVGMAMAARAWELRIKTPAGSGTWLRLESFRRFLANSEAQHVERAASMGLLREYTAWAVALGEVDRWTRAMQQTTVVPPDVISTAMVAHSLSRATSSTSTQPSSSSSGGGGGGVGGGGGGGGGGSW